jgi:hypothetical protein
MGTNSSSSTFIPILQQPRLLKKTQFSLTLILPVSMDLVSYCMGDICLVVVFYVMLQDIFMVSYSYVGIVFTLILFLNVCVCVSNIIVGCVCQCVVNNPTWITMVRWRWYTIHCSHQNIWQFGRWIWVASPSVDVMASSLSLGLTLLIVLVSFFVGHLWNVVVIYVPNTLMIWTLSLGAIPQVDVIVSSSTLLLTLSMVSVSCLVGCLWLVVVIYGDVTVYLYSDISLCWNFLPH